VSSIDNVVFLTAAVLGRLPGTTVYRNILQYPDAFIYYGIVILRIDSPIYFANINFIKER
jgi:sulfate transporter 4